MKDHSPSQQRTNTDLVCVYAALSHISAHASELVAPLVITGSTSPYVLIHTRPISVELLSDVSSLRPMRDPANPPR